MRLKFIPVALIATVVAGCGSDDGPAPVTEATVELNEYGVIRVAYETGTDQTALDAVFCALGRPASAGSIDEQFLTGKDTCTVTTDGSGPANEIMALNCGEVLAAQTVSAGANLLLSSNAGSYADLPRQANNDEISYSAGNLLPRPPDGLTLDIPGDETFPAFSAVEIPDLEDIQLTSPAEGDIIGGDTAFRWTAARDRTNSRLLLSASDAGVTLSCSLNDDGRFDFPGSTRAELGDLFAATTLTVRRQNFSSPTRGDSGLVIITSIE